MRLKQRVRDFEDKWSKLFFKIGNAQKQSFECPLCGYKGPFMEIIPATGRRKHAKCPNCNAVERHRLQYLVLKDVLSTIDASKWKMLHFAPEPFFRVFFLQRFGKYETADLDMPGVDYHVDLQRLPFCDGAYDFVFASHVLEHVPDDEKAISEIRRILTANGMAILPVPIVAEKTIEYPAPNPHEGYHVRAPGIDYFKRYERYFSKVEVFSSVSQPDKYQTYVYENRSTWPSAKLPWRSPMPGEKHIDIVPVCHA